MQSMAQLAPAILTENELREHLTRVLGNDTELILRYNLTEQLDPADQELLQHLSRKFSLTIIESPDVTGTAKTLDELISETERDITTIDVYPEKLGGPLSSSRKALSAKKLGWAFAENPARLDRLAINTNDGRQIISEVLSDRKFGVDEDLDAGMVNALLDFTSETRDLETREWVGENGAVFIQPIGEHAYITADITGAGNWALREDLQDISTWIDINFGSELANWDGTRAEEAELGEIPKRFLQEGLDYALKRLHVYDGQTKHVDARTRQEDIATNVETALRTEAKSGHKIRIVAITDPSVNTLALKEKAAQDTTSHISFRGLTENDVVDYLVRHKLADESEAREFAQVYMNKFSESRSVRGRKLNITDYSDLSDITQQLSKRSAFPLVEVNPNMLRGIKLTDDNEHLRRFVPQNKTASIIANYIAMNGSEFTLEELCGLPINKETGLKKIFRVRKSSFDDRRVRLSQALDELIEIGLVKEHPDKIEHYIISNPRLKTAIENKIKEDAGSAARLQLDWFRSLDGLYGDEPFEHQATMAQQGYNSISAVKNRRELEDHIRRTLIYNSGSGDEAAEIFANHEAIQFYEQALKCVDHLKGSMDQRVSLLKKTQAVRQRISDWSGALRNNQELIHLGASLDDILLQAEAEKNIGEIHLSEDNPNKAEAHLESSRSKYKSLGNKEGLSDVIRFKGEALWKQGASIDELLPIFEQSRQLAHEARDKFLEGRANLSLGIVYSNNKMYKQAKEHLDDSLSLFKDAKDLAFIARAHNGLGNMYLEKGDLTAALDQFERCLAIPTYSITRTFALSNITEVHARNLAVEQALRFGKKTIDTATRWGDRFSIAAVKEDIGNMYLALAKDAPTEEILQMQGLADTNLAEAEKIYEDLGVHPNRLERVRTSRGNIRMASIEAKS